MAKQEASYDGAHFASVPRHTWVSTVPQHPWVSTAIGMQTQPSPVHLKSLALCFLSSAAKAADPAVTLASDYMKLGVM